MIDVLIGALKISLKECNKYDHPCDYLYEINQVLNRFKSNLYNLIPDKTKHLYDAKEFIQIKLSLGWKIYPTFTNGVIVKERSPVMLHINGLIPEFGMRKNREQTFTKAVDVSDIIDLTKIANLKSDYYLNKDETLTEVKMIEEYLGSLDNLCIYYSRDALSYGVNSFTVQVSGMVYSHVDKDERSLVDSGVVLHTERTLRNKLQGHIAGNKSAAARAKGSLLNAPLQNWLK